jgi:16S rRNA (adenine1518-N6/adenine1519-N6)-dimethyltransferase
METTSKKTVKILLRGQKTLPQKKFGQNFLIDKGVINKFMEAAGIQKDDIVVEVGPGTGILTLELAKRAKRVIAIEKDEKMTEILDKTLEEFKNVKIIHGDIRQPQSWETETGNRYKVVANIPFYLTAFLIRSFLEKKPPRGWPPQEMTLVIQKEVAQRICSKVPDMNLLAVCVQFYAKPKIISYISKKSFWPIPKVDSAIIKISDIKNQLSENERDYFFKIVKAGFSQPRKQILNNLSGGLRTDKSIVKSWLLKNNVESVRRAETLSMEDWISLAKDFIIK